MVQKEPFQPTLVEHQKDQKDLGENYLCLQFWKKFKPKI